MFLKLLPSLQLLQLKCRNGFLSSSLSLPLSLAIYIIDGLSLLAPLTCITVFRYYTLIAP